MEESESNGLTRYVREDGAWWTVDCIVADLIAQGAPIEWRL
jgi:hypothetical protein